MRVVGVGVLSECRLALTKLPTIQQRTHPSRPNMRPNGARNICRSGRATIRCKHVVGCVVVGCAVVVVVVATKGSTNYQRHEEQAVMAMEADGNDTGAATRKASMSNRQQGLYLMLDDPPGQCGHFRCLTGAQRLLEATINQVGVRNALLLVPWCVFLKDGL